MRVEGAAVTIGLDREESLRLRRGTTLEVVCLSGVVWITQEGDLRDLFLAPGESIRLRLRGVALITALEPAAVKVRDGRVPHAASAPSVRSSSYRTGAGVQGLWSRWRSGAVMKLRGLVVG